MTYQVRVTGAARRELNRLPEAVAAAVLEFLGTELAEHPHRVGKALDEPLKGLHSARRGVYRIVYRINEEVVEVQVIRIRHRRDAYRRD